MGASLALDSRETGVRVWHCDPGGGEVVIDLVDAALTRFEDGRPYRHLASYKGQRNFVGSWWFQTTGTHVAYESWVERDQVMLMDRDRDVVAVASQPFAVELDVVGGKPYRHVPDFFVRRRDSSAAVVDVRLESRIEGDAAVFAATRAACSLVGWDYAVLGEVNPLTRAHVGWLAAYRHPRCGLLGADWVDLRAAIAQRPGGVALGEVGDLVGCGNLAVLPHVYHRLWRGDLVCDEQARWSLGMTIRVGEMR